MQLWLVAASPAFRTAPLVVAPAVRSTTPAMLGRSDVGRTTTYWPRGRSSGDYRGTGRGGYYAGDSSSAMGRASARGRPWGGRDGPYMPGIRGNWGPAYPPPPYMADRFYGRGPNNRRPMPYGPMGNRYGGRYGGNMYNEPYAYGGGAWGEHREWAPRAGRWADQFDPYSPQQRLPPQLQQQLPQQYVPNGYPQQDQLAPSGKLPSAGAAGYSAAARDEALARERAESTKAAELAAREAAKRAQEEADAAAEALRVEEEAIKLREQEAERLEQEASAARERAKSSAEAAAADASKALQAEQSAAMARRMQGNVPGNVPGSAGSRRYGVNPDERSAWGGQRQDYLQPPQSPARGRARTPGAYI